MTSYNFSTVNDVLPLGLQRAYVPRASRPHLGWAAASPADSLGGHCRLKGDGTAARETPESLKEHEMAEQSDAHGTVSSSAAATAHSVVLRGLLTTDNATGTQLTLYHDLATPHVPVCSSVIPSKRRAVALWSPPSALEDGLAHLWDGSLPLFVCDGAGNVFHHAWQAEGGVAEPSVKRPRRDPGAGSGDVGAEAWTAVASAHSSIPFTMAAPPAPHLPSAGPEMESFFSVTRGAPGWAGLGALSADGATDVLRLVSVREFYHDVRVIDPVQREVVRVYSTTHAPTGMLCTSAQAAPHCVLVTEGCLVTLFDVRCPSAVLSLGEVYAAQAEWTAVKEAAAAEKAQQESHGTVTENGKGETARDAKPASAAPQLPALVPGRLTSTVGLVRDVCGTANPFEVACAVDRALCVYDLRRFSRLFTSSSVLKYVVGSVTAVAGGRGVVCAGIDSEVRLVPLHDKTDTTAGEALSLAARVVAQAQKKKQRSDTPKKADGADGTVAAFDVDTMGPGGTFRTRLNTSVSCTSVWQGGWVTTQDVSGLAAVGVSVDGEVFLAQ